MNADKQNVDMLGTDPFAARCFRGLLNITTK
jgi:hypothetical protein